MGKKPSCCTLKSIYNWTGTNLKNSWVMKAVGAWDFNAEGRR